VVDPPDTAVQSDVGKSVAGLMSDNFKFASQTMTAPDYIHSNQSEIGSDQTALPSALHDVVADIREQFAFSGATLHPDSHAEPSEPQTHWVHAPDGFHLV